MYFIIKIFYKFNINKKYILNLYLFLFNFYYNLIEFFIILYKIFHYKKKNLYCQNKKW